MWFIKNEIIYRDKSIIALKFWGRLKYVSPDNVFETSAPLGSFSVFPFGENVVTSPLAQVRPGDATTAAAQTPNTWPFLKIKIKKHARTLRRTHVRYRTYAFTIRAYVTAEGWLIIARILLFSTAVVKQAGGTAIPRKVYIVCVTKYTYIL